MTPAFLRPAAQAQTTEDATPAPDQGSPSPPLPAEVQPDGTVPGVDGMLSQVSAALVTQLQNSTIPSQVGAAAGAKLAAPLWALALIAGGYAVYRVARHERRVARRAGR